MEATIKISVVICTYNRQQYILDALASLRNQTMNKDDFEIIVVNNNSPDNTEVIVKNYIKEHPELNLIYLLETKQGASFARNKGAAVAKANLLVFMDDDAIAEPDYLVKVIEFYKKHPNTSGLGGRIIPRYIPGKPEWMSHFVSSLVGNFDYSKNVEEFKPGKYPLESNMIIRKEDFNLVNGFNTELPGVKGTLRIGGEGKDFFLRLQNEGKRIFYDPAIIVHHVVEVNKLTSEYMYRVASGIGRGERVRTKAISEWSYIKKVLEYLYKLSGSIVLGIIYAAKGNPKQSWPVVKFRIDALKGLLGY